jgi:hypothetical protein
MTKKKKKKKKPVLAPLGMYEKSFVTEVLRAHHNGLSIEEIAVYLDILPEEVNHVLDLYIPIVEAMGSLTYTEEDDEQST